MAGPARDVLIVEDDLAVAEAIRDGIVVSGHTVCGIATTAEQAIALMRLCRPRLAVIDVDLGGGCDGLEVARRLLAIAPVGVMFVTGHPEKVRSADVGHAWMPKPYRLLDLINALEVVTALSAQRPISAPVPTELRLIGDTLPGGLA
ncbi:MAG: response regulator [Alphaproteobacteria bacterium]|nr:response regulator [Alphaproteobacteria bacterium]